MGWGFQHMQREGAGEGGSVYLRLSTPHARAARSGLMTPDLQKSHYRRRLLAAQTRRKLCMKRF